MPLPHSTRSLSRLAAHVVCVVAAVALAAGPALPAGAALPALSASPTSLQKSAAKTKIRMTSTAPQRVASGTTITVSAHLTPATAGRKVTFRTTMTGGKWRKVSRATTNASGIATVELAPPDGKIVSRASVSSTKTRASKRVKKLSAATARPMRFTVGSGPVSGAPSSLTLSVPQSTSSAAPINVTARVTPAAPGRIVTLERRDGWGGTWAAWRTLTTDAAGTATAAFTSAPQYFEMRASVEPSSVYAAASSDVATLDVRDGTSPAAHPHEYKFTRTGQVGPARWNPCVPVHWRYNPSGERGPWALNDIKAAFTQLSAATGISFVYDGTSTDVPFPGGSRSTIGNNGGEDIIVGWGTSASHPGMLSPSVVGMGGWSGLDRSGQIEMISGGVVVNSDYNASPGFASSKGFGAVFLHELGHAVGLAHVDANRQIMQPLLKYGWHTGPEVGYNVGDRTGLSLLGASAGCLTSPVRREATTSTPAGRVAMVASMFDATPFEAASRPVVVVFTDS